MTTRVRNRLLAVVGIAMAVVVLAINIAYAVVLAHHWWSRSHAAVERVDAVAGHARAVSALSAMDARALRMPYLRGGVLSRREAPAKDSANGTPAATSNDRLACMDRGWFATRRERDRAKERLQVLGAHTREYEASLSGADYLVFVRPAGSLSLARQTQGDLATQSISGFLEMNASRRFAVVVGVSSNQAEATALRDAVAGLGYDTAIERLDRGGRIFGLLAYHVPKAHAASVPHRACPDVATEPWFL